MLLGERLVNALPARGQNQVDAFTEIVCPSSRSVKDPRASSPALGPAGIRGLVLQRGKQGGTHEDAGAHHAAHFDWSVPSPTTPRWRSLYSRGQAGGSGTAMCISLGRRTSTPSNPEVPLLPDNYFDWAGLERCGITLEQSEKTRFGYSMTSWMFSQFLHGEQGAPLRCRAGHRGRPVLRRQALRRDPSHGRRTPRRSLPSLPR